MSKKLVQDDPLILTYLEGNQIQQIIRLMFNRKISEELLMKYGQKIDGGPKKRQELLLDDYANRFSVKDIVMLKGSQKQSGVKYYCNTFIADFLLKKLKKGYNLTNEDRRLAYPQLTEYFQLEHLYNSLQDLQLPPQIIATIAKDVKRTYISLQLYSNLSPEQKLKIQTQMRRRLTQILEAIAKYNPYISYCQGMNTIILFFIQQKFTNSQIFFIFKKISEELLPCDFYSSMESPVAYVKVLFQILKHTHPMIVKKLRHIIKNMDGDNQFIITLSFVFQWFICLFTNINLSRKIRLKIMDHFLIEGVPILFKASLAFFDILEQQIQQKELYSEEYLPIVEKGVRQFENETLLQSKLTNTYINSSLLNLLKEKMVMKGRNPREREEKKPCKSSWTMCMQALEDTLANGQRSDFFVFRTGQSVRFIDNYFDKVNNQYFRIGKSSSRTDLLRLGRMPHSCRLPSSSSNTNTGHTDSFLEYQEGSSGKRQILSPAKGQAIQKKQFVRSKALENLQSSFQGRQSVFNRSESMQFMRSMIENESFTNLLQILEEDEKQTIFKSIIEEDSD